MANDAYRAHHSVKAGRWYNACDVRWDFSADGLTLEAARKVAVEQSAGGRFAAIYSPDGEGPGGILLNDRYRDGEWME